MTTLGDMLEQQLTLQIESFGKDPTRLTGEERAEFIRWNMLALTDELHEALNEVGWKPWATNRDIDSRAFLKEMVDAWHFFMNLMLTAAPGLGDEISSAQDLGEWFAEQYMAKRRINAQRQTDGYDGVKDKCPTCRRSFDDVVATVELGGVTYCKLDCAPSQSMLFPSPTRSSHDC